MKQTLFLIQIILYIMITMSTIMMIWIYTTFEYWIKGMITIIILSVMIDVFKKYVYTKWILDKHTEEKT